MRLYVGEWHINAGLVGFNRIIQESDIDKELYNYKVTEEYIEFDDDLLKEFSTAFFKYYLTEYDKAKSTKEKIDKSMAYLYSIVAKENDETDNAKLKFLKDSIKKTFADIKTSIKIVNSTIQKHKNIDDEDKELLDAVNTKIQALKNCSDEIMQMLKIFTEEYLELMKKVSETLTFDIVITRLRGMCGQGSYLNVSVPSSKKREKFYDDYIYDIVKRKEFETKIEYINTTKDLEDYIKDQEIKAGSYFNHFIENLKFNFIKNKKDISTLKEFINKEYFKCMIFGNETSFGQYLVDSDFIALAISNDNAQNYFYNDSAIAISDIARLIMHCIDAGTTRTYKRHDFEYRIMKGVKFSDEKAKQEEQGKHYYNTFINCNCDLKETIKHNNNFKYRKKDAVFEEYMLDIVSTEKTKAKLQLINMTYVDFRCVYRPKYSIVLSNAFDRHVVEFLTSNYINLVKFIKDSSLRALTLNAVINNSSLIELCNTKLRECLRNEEEEKDKSKFSFVRNSTMEDCFNILLIDEASTSIKIAQGGKVMDKKLRDRLTNLGTSVAKAMKNSGEEHKIRGIAYQLLNAANSGDKEYALFLMTSLLMQKQLEFSSDIVELNNNDGDCSGEIMAFVIGLNRDYYYLDEEGKKKKAEEKAQSQVQAQTTATETK